MEEQAKKIADLLKIVANKHRLLILCALLKGRLSVGEIHKCSPNITASAISQHLRQLKTAVILAAEKQCMHVIYWIQDPPIIAFMQTLQEHFCTEERR